MSSLGVRLEAGLVHDGGVRYLEFRISLFGFQIPGFWFRVLDFGHVICHQSVGYRDFPSLTGMWGGSLTVLEASITQSNRGEYSL